LISAILDRFSGTFPATIRLHAKGLPGALRLAFWRVPRPAQTSHFAASAQVSPVESFFVTSAHGGPFGHHRRPAKALKAADTDQIQTRNRLRPIILI
jgi:hypothetical protein